MIGRTLIALSLLCYGLSNGVAAQAARAQAPAPQIVASVLDR